MSKLTKAEKNQIIINESRGIQHPLYYVCTTKSGNVQVRKRKVPLNFDRKSDESERKEEHNENEQTKDNYDAITNKQILEKMLSILENQVVSKDNNLNSVENEKVTAENKKFVENIAEKVDHEPAVNCNPYSVRRHRGRIL